MKFAEIDYPPINIEQLFVNESQSYEKISFSTKHHETLPKTIETSADTILSSSDKTRSTKLDRRQQHHQSKYQLILMLRI